MAKQGTLLVVDDNRNILTSLQYLLEEYFQQVITLNSPVTIPSLLQREAIDVVLLDMNFSSGINSGNEGLYWLREIKRLRPQIQVVLFTAYADINGTKGWSDRLYRKALGQCQTGTDSARSLCQSSWKRKERKAGLTADGKIEYVLGKFLRHPSATTVG